MTRAWRSLLTDYAPVKGDPIEYCYEHPFAAFIPDISTEDFLRNDMVVKNGRGSAFNGRATYLETPGKSLYLWPHQHQFDAAGSYSSECIMRQGYVLNFMQGFRHVGEKSLKANPKENLYLGIEIECGPRFHNHPFWIRMLADDIDDFANVKQEQNTAYGIEINSVPGTLAWHQSGVWERFFSNSSAWLNGSGNYGCGMHVHINRKAIKDETLAKMLIFLANPDNDKLISSIAGRQANSYCSRLGDVYTAQSGTDDLLRLYHMNTAKAYALHYSSTTGGGTAELRIFQGNVSRNGVYKALEFSAMLVLFCDDANIEQLTAKRFLGWAHEYRVNYPNFAAWAVKRSLLESKGEDTSFAEAA